MSEYQKSNLENIGQVGNYHLVWIYSGRLDQVFDSATWLEPTQELRRLGWRVSLIAFGTSGTHSIQDVEVFCIPTINIYFIRHLVFHLQLYIFLWENRTSIDFIMFHQTSALWILPLKVVRWVIGATRPSFVMDTRTVLMEDAQKATWKDWLRGQLYRVTSRLANRWADGQTANTQRMAECVGVPPERLWGIWPAGANADLFLQSYLDRFWPSETEPIQVMYIGVVNYERNLMALCQAIELAHREGMQFILAITGDGTARSELEQFATHSQGRIILNKPIPHNEVPKLLSKAHIGVIPFPDEEKFRVGSPIKLFEYIAAGLPILATRIACHTDVVGGSDFIFWVEDGSVEGLLTGLRNVWHRRCELQRLGQQAVLAAENYTWRASARNLSISLITHQEKSKVVLNRI